MHWARRAASRADWTAGKSSPASTPMIAMTTSNSIKVKPRVSLKFRLMVGILCGKRSLSLAKQQEPRSVNCFSVQAMLVRSQAAKGPLGSPTCSRSIVGWRGRRCRRGGSRGGGRGCPTGGRRQDRAARLLLDRGHLVLRHHVDGDLGNGPAKRVRFFIVKGQPGLVAATEEDLERTRGHVETWLVDHVADVRQADVVLAKLVKKRFGTAFGLLLPSGDRAAAGGDHSHQKTKRAGEKGHRTSRPAASEGSSRERDDKQEAHGEPPRNQPGVRPSRIRIAPRSLPRGKAFSKPKPAQGPARPVDTIKG